MIYESLLDAIGNTPLVRVPCDVDVRLYAKLEYLNPGGSVKDRSALFLIDHAEKNGLLKPGYTLIDASSGNHGISLAMIGASRGYKVIITVSEKISQEKLAAIKAYGAEVIMCPLTDTIDDPRSYHSVARSLAQSVPNSYMPNQYFNPHNATAHYHLLGAEIWRQTQGAITHFVAAAGTCGTVSGVGSYLKEKKGTIRTIAVDSIHSYKATQGNPKPYYIEGMGIDFDTPVMNASVIDEFVTVTDADAFSFLKLLAHDYGLLVGPSSGAVAHVAFTHAKKAPKNSIIVMIFGDSGRAYLTKQFYDNALDPVVLQHKVPLAVAAVE
jgi:cystathionine beta-synthase